MAALNTLMSWWFTVAESPLPTFSSPTLRPGPWTGTLRRPPGVSGRTAHRRNADPAFWVKVADLRVGMVATAAGRWADEIAEAARVLRGLLADHDPRVRLAAAANLLDAGLTTVNLTGLEGSVADLEGRIRGAGSGRPAPAAV